MESDIQRFNSCLEQYVFQVAEVFITEVEEEAQTRLIKLFIDIGNESVEKSIVEEMN